MFRKTENIVKGQTASIGNIASTEFQIVDSLNKVFDFQAELSRLYGSFSSQSGNSFTDEWGFLKRWNLLSNLEKHSKYNQYVSHELHFFLYLKDQAFFDSVVVPHISNKIERSLVDYFLLSELELLV